MTPQWLLNAMTQTCVIYNRAEVGTDEYGNAVYEDQIAATSRCLLQPVSQAEIQLGRAGVGTYTLFLPAEVETALTSFSAFEVNTVLYEAEGPPAVYSQLYQPHVHHIEVNVGKSSA